MALQNKRVSPGTYLLADGPTPAPPKLWARTLCVLWHTALSLTITGTMERTTGWSLAGTLDGKLMWVFNGSRGVASPFAPDVCNSVLSHSLAEFKICSKKDNLKNPSRYASKTAFSNRTRSSAACIPTSHLFPMVRNSNLQNISSMRRLLLAEESIP